jgi:hypothetical protein
VDADSGHVKENSLRITYYLLSPCTMHVALSPSEGVLIVGRSSHSDVATFVDWTSRFAKSAHLPSGHNAAAVCHALTGLF